MKNSDQNNEIDWDLLAKYLAKEATDEDIERVENWLALDEDNGRKLEELKISWELSKAVRIDEKQTWQQLQGKLKSEQKRSLSVFYKIAASLLLIATVFFLVKNQTKQIVADKLVTFNSGDSRITINFEDGSAVYLNKNTTIKYPKEFSDSVRQVFIDGEGFFEVAKKYGTPFIVSTTRLDVKVLGTSFNVDSYSGKSEEAIEVSTGTVTVSRAKILSKNSDQLILSETEMAKFFVDKDSLFKSPIKDKNYLAWKTELLEFERTSLSEVIKTLNEVYDKNILINDQGLNNCLLTARFDNKSLADVLEALTSTYNLEIEQASKGITIYGKGCN